MGGIFEIIGKSPDEMSGEITGIIIWKISIRIAEEASEGILFSLVENTGGISVGISQNQSMEKISGEFLKESLEKSLQKMHAKIVEKY